jgi:hypothetical protein
VRRQRHYLLAQCCSDAGARYGVHARASAAQQQEGRRSTLRRAALVCVLVTRRARSTRLASSAHKTARACRTPRSAAAAAGVASPGHAAILRGAHPQHWTPLQPPSRVLKPSHMRIARGLTWHRISRCCCTPSCQAPCATWLHSGSVSAWRGGAGLTVNQRVVSAATALGMCTARVLRPSALRHRRSSRACGVANALRGACGAAECDAAASACTPLERPQPKGGVPRRSAAAAPSGTHAHRVRARHFAQHAARRLQPPHGARVRPGAVRTWRRARLCHLPHSGRAL